MRLPVGKNNNLSNNQIGLYLFDYFWYNRYEVIWMHKCNVRTICKDHRCCTCKYNKQNGYNEEILCCRECMKNIYCYWESIKCC